MDEWAEACADTEEVGDYVIMEGELYSLRLPYQGATPCPRLMIPTGERDELIKEAHQEIGHRAWLPKLRFVQG